MGWTVVIMSFMLFAKWMLITCVSAFNGQPLIHFQPFEQQYMAFNFVVYGLHSPIQEFITRGVLQGSLQHFLVGKHIVTRSILISNALFAATHVHLFGGVMALVVFIPGLFWGWLYSRHPTILGVSISHILIGWWGLFVLSF
jgi:membrane protease YdiL (CAAX protease family)